jgi:hypothetical protein
MSLLKKVLFVPPVLVAVIVTMSILDRQDKYDVSLEGLEIPTFETSDIVFDQGNDFSTSLPFFASAIIDVDGDGVDEVFLGGSQTTPDGLFEFKDNRLVAIEGAAGLQKGKVASFGSIVLDVDKNGTADLLVAREDGLWLHRNNNGVFSNEKLDAQMPSDTTALSIAVADLNRDGAFDMYVSGYIRNDLVEGQNLFTDNYGGTSQLFINNGDNTFTNMTKESGLFYKHNTFQSAFIDVDRDGFEDLVVAHDTGHVLTWKNNGDMTFTRQSNPLSEEFGYPMGIGITDLGNDGFTDFYFSNVGSTPPDFVVRGTLTDEQVSNWKWLLFKNNGDFNFTDVAEETKIADYAFSWGAAFSDLNLDGTDDLIVSENYIGYPFHKLEALRLNGRVLLQKENGEFASVGEQAGVRNRHYSISPLTADFNQDGRPDIIHANLNGNSKLFLSKPGKGNYLNVRLPNDVSSIASHVKVELTNGKILSRPYVSGEGLCSDSSHDITFGLADSSVKSVTVNYIDGRVENKVGTFTNETLSF